jgi:hypothetical protein
MSASHIVYRDDIISTILLFLLHHIAATIDDISVFVIPIGPYRRDWMEKLCIENSGASDSDNSESLNGSLSDKSETQKPESHETALDALETVLNEVTNGIITNVELEEPNH